MAAAVLPGAGAGAGALAGAPFAGAGGPAIAAVASDAHLPVPVALPAVNVPDIVEDRRTDSVGTVLVRRYLKGRLLGKVRAIAGEGRCLYRQLRARGG